MIQEKKILKFQKSRFFIMRHIIRHFYWLEQKKEFQNYKKLWSGFITLLKLIIFYHKNEMDASEPK